MDGVSSSLCSSVLDQEREVSESFGEGDQKGVIQLLKVERERRICCGVGTESVAKKSHEQSVDSSSALG